MAFRFFLYLLLLGLLVACGSSPASSSAPPAATSAPEAAAAIQPPTNAPEVAATNAPAEDRSAAIPTGKTPEGYNVLGDPNAPITIVMYSDFL